MLGAFKADRSSIFFVHTRSCCTPNGNNNNHKQTTGCSSIGRLESPSGRMFAAGSPLRTSTASAALFKASGTALLLALRLRVCFIAAGS
jgi:hypothetical protein